MVRLDVDNNGLPPLVLKHFQYYSGAIRCELDVDTMLPISVFNTTVVRLDDSIKRDTKIKEQFFNTTVVRLDVIYSVSNPTYTLFSILQWCD